MAKFILVVAALVCAACANKDATSASGRPHATLLMRDGSSVAGIVTASSPTQITLEADDHTTRTFEMKQVKSIQYDDPATTQAQAPPTETDTAHESHYHPPQSAVQTKTYVLPVGTEIAVRTEETIDSGKAAEGQTYAAEVARDVRDAEGAIVIPRGSNAQIVIRSASKGGRIRGAADLVLDLRSVSIEGQEYQLQTANLSRRGKEGVGANQRTAEYTGGGAAIGAIIGAIAGGGKGAAIGAGSGAGAGALTQILTKGSIRVPAETVLTFKLDRSLSVDAAR
jgi:hypothetical protein